MGDGWWARDGGRGGWDISAMSLLSPKLKSWLRRWRVVRREGRDSKGFSRKSVRPGGGGGGSDALQCPLAPRPRLLARAEMVQSPTQLSPAGVV